MTLYEAMREYSEFIKLQTKRNTAARSLDDIRIFTIFMHNAPVYKVNDNDVIDHLKELQELGYAHNCVAKKAGVLRRFFEWLQKKGYHSVNPALIPKMRLIPIMPRVSTEDDYRKILDTIPTQSRRYVHTRNRAIIMMLWDTGARVGEICSLDVADLNLEGMKAVIRTEKSRGLKPFREVYWTEDTNQALRDWMERRSAWQAITEFQDSGALFIGSGRNSIGRRISSSSVGLLLRKLSLKAHIPCFNAHSARHAFGIDLAMQGANNSTISSLMGHSSLASSFIYTELNNSDREKQYNKFKRNKHLQQ